MLLVLSDFVPSARAFVYETPLEFISAGDFNGDGQADILLVSRDKGRVRIGYALGGGIFDWSDWRDSGVKSVSGVSVGKLFDSKRDGVAVVSEDVNQLAVLDAVSPSKPTDPVRLPASSMIGPNLVLALDISGEGNTPLADLLVPSTLNPDDNPNKATLFRNSGGKFTQLAEFAVPVSGKHGNVISLKAGGPELAAAVCTSDAGTMLVAGSAEVGKLNTLLTISNVPAGSDYVLGHFRGAALPDFVVYSPGNAEITIYPIEATGAAFQAGASKSFTLAKPVNQLVLVQADKKERLLALFGEQEPAELLDFDGVKPPSAVQELLGATNKFLKAAAVLPDTLLLLSTVSPTNREISHYQCYLHKDGKFEPGSYGSLPTLDDRDDATVPEIHGRIVASLKEKSAADMKAYTNTIPGTDVPYSMVAIPGGEFLMGSSAGEAGRKPTEGPQHRVKVSPFWMGQFEVTWDQFVPYMDRDGEKKLRAAFTTDAGIDAISDAVTRPTRPYVDMSFGMGKAGFPAIAMTQHAANKFCHWLSARTGHFYRLPTEAEWEYACRAGSTTAYFFGNDPAMLEPGVSAGVIRESSGTVELQKAGAGNWLPAKVGQTLQAGDKLRTASDSRALVQFAYQPKPFTVSEKSTNEVPVPDYLGEFAWYFSNANDKYQKVGQKRPNPWGLFDMHGNVREWTLDQFDENYYASFTGKDVIMDPWNKATKPYPHSSRGGSWYDDPAELRSASRIPSTKQWKMQDPQLPKSRWWLSDAQWIGIRLVRPLKAPSAEEMVKYWTSGVDKD